MTVPSVPSPPSLPPSAPPAPPDAPPGALPKAVRGQWSRLHPFSPVLRFSRAAAGLVVLLAARRTSPGGTHGGEWIWDLAVLALAVVGGVVAWAVTRWRVEGSELQIETGLIRRQSVRVPLSRVQSIDVVRPLLARAVGVSELRVEVAGHGSGKSKLAYLGEDEALRVRARLLAVAHGLDEDTPEPLQ
ncbi:MAG: putative rane protein, partial [Frankiales bacterium]|nr:putative rane protein [Frankiales bacterium]